MIESFLLLVSCSHSDLIKDIVFKPDDHSISMEMAESYARLFSKQFLCKEFKAKTRNLSTSHESFAINNERGLPLMNIINFDEGFAIVNAWYAFSIFQPNNSIYNFGSNMKLVYNICP